METTTATAAQAAQATPPTPVPLEEIRGQFPLLARQQDGKPLAYLDNGATSQKPLAVIEALDRYWREQNANVHRGVYRLSEEATDLYERARRVVAARLGADRREVVFVRNATEALNLVAYSWGRANVGDGDRILLTEMEHHSNIVPWYQLAVEKGAKLDWAPVTDTGRLDLEAFRSLLERRPRIVAVAHVSNVLGTINPIPEITRMAHDAGALVVVDGAQAGPKLPLDMAQLGADFYALTSHKMYGPTGIGALYGRRELLDEMPPFIGGGTMIRRVRRDEITWAELPAKFEGGTPAIGEAIGYAAAVEWLDAVGLDAAHAHEVEVTELRAPAPGGDPGPAAVRTAGRRRSGRDHLVRHGGRPRSRRLGDPRPARGVRASGPPLRPDPHGPPRRAGDHPRQLRRLQHHPGGRPPGRGAPRRAAGVRARLSGRPRGITRAMIPVGGGGPPGQLTAWRRSVPWLVLGLLMALSSAFILMWSTHETLHGDEWGYANRTSVLPTSEYLFDPPPSKHLIAIPLLLYKAAFEGFGISSYVPYRLAHVALLLLCAGLFYALARRRIGDCAGGSPDGDPALFRKLLGGGRHPAPQPKPGRDRRRPRDAAGTRATRPEG